jgi:hypothetical protein
VQIIFSNCAGMIGQGPSMVTWTHLATSSGTRLQVRALKHQWHGKWYPTFFCAISRMVILLWWGHHWSQGIGAHKSWILHAREEYLESWFEPNFLKYQPSKKHGFLRVSFFLTDAQVRATW